MRDQTVDIMEAITECLQLIILRGIMWVAIMIHFSPWVATLALIAVVAGTIVAEMLLDDISILLDVVLSILSFIAVLNVTDHWLFSLGGVLVVNLLIRLRFFPF